ncbi:hypothetical protein [Paractinoplanes toevensis]|uniref:hypothetical protein n=1 Tax=Paractinoplanes toevensis TaxID=571911 RepID=UPI001FE283B0|nr:hypothetical protein [Actinoplanes toevensis]
MLNAMASNHFNVADALVGAARKPPIVWVRGDRDVIVSDTSLFDRAYLGSLGEVPEWPGADACPPQPMVARPVRCCGDTRATVAASVRSSTTTAAPHHTSNARPSCSAAFAVDAQPASPDGTLSPSAPLTRTPAPLVGDINFGPCQHRRSAEIICGPSSKAGGYQRSGMAVGIFRTIPFPA